MRVFVAGNVAGASKPAVLHIHGGGYVMGSAGMSRRDIQELSTTHNCVAVSVDYRLAPETRFPGSLEDNYAALRWMHTNAKELGIDVKRIAIKGESAGGGHAAGLAIAARDRGEFPICLQVLIYPMLDNRTGASARFPSSSASSFGEQTRTASGGPHCWASRPDRPRSRRTPCPRASPISPGFRRCSSASGALTCLHPRTSNNTTAHERGRDEELHVVPGAFHGFDFFGETTLSRQFAHAWNESLRRAFA